MAVMVVQGNVKTGHLTELEDLATSGRQVLWTAPKSASPGDIVAFYLIRPTASIVATGLVQTTTEDGAPHGWPGHYMAHIGDISMVDTPVTLERLRTLFPDWDYLKTPRRETHVPAEHEAKLLRALAVPGAASIPTEWSVQENLRREARILSRSRNRALRERVVADSRGVCDACDVDLSKVVPNHWRSVLQAHHKRPLHTLDDVTNTTASDLLVLCPTCHVLAHVGRRDRPRGLPTLRSLMS